MIAVAVSLLIIAFGAWVLATRFCVLLLLSLVGWICNSRCTHPDLPRSMTEQTCFNCWMHARVESLGHDIGDLSKAVREYFTSAEFWLPVAAIVVIVIIAVI
jgi:hypothetical protein